MVNEARKSSHAYPSSQAEAEALIYNYEILYTNSGKAGGGSPQIYVFPPYDAGITEEEGLMGDGEGRGWSRAAVGEIGRSGLLGKEEGGRPAMIEREAAAALRGRMRKGW